MLCIFQTVIGVMFNCCEPESISSALREINQNNQHIGSQILLGAYANRLRPVAPDWTLESSEEAQAMREDLSPERYWNDFVRLWHSSNKDSATNDMGVIGGQVQLVGGCCGIGPDHISVLKERLAAEKAM